MTENRAYFAVGVLMVVVSLLCAVGSRLNAPPPAPPSGPYGRNHPVERPELGSLDLKPEPEPDPRVAYVNEALQAVGEAAGHGVIGCPLPDGIDRGAVLWGASRQERTGDVIRATVPEAAGAAPIGVSATDPVAVAVWRDAWPGEAGVCTVEPRSLLEHRVTVEGGPAELALSGTCHEALMDEGVLFVRQPAWLPCTVVAKGGGLRGELRIAAEEPTNDLVLAMAPDDGTATEPVPPAMAALTPAQIDDALESPGLSPGARVILKLWKPEVEPSGDAPEPPIPE
ncbi:MAG: hypothetical protein H6737_03310 [Alphaproteobacteria bacterium]|nr:hypothetical protein [Alphaproteobacteria bacterium]